MFTLRTLRDAERSYWEVMYPRAVAEGANRAMDPRAIADGCDRTIGPLDERIAASDELIAFAVPELAILHRWATLAELAPNTVEYAHLVADHASAAIRLLDSALTTHGHENEYATDTWREHVITIASVCAQSYSALKEDISPLCCALHQSTHNVARVLQLVPRDRAGVPEALVDAQGPLLVVYAAATPQSARQ